MLEEFAFIEKEYAEEIVNRLQLVLDGKLDKFEFGYDATIIDFYRDKSIINYDYLESELEFDSQCIYVFMKDWFKYLTNFDYKGK